MMYRKYPVTSGSVVIKPRAFNSDRFYVKDNKTKASGFANEDAKALLLLCDGTNTVDEIIERLKRKYRGTAEVRKRAIRTIRFFKEIGMLKLSTKPYYRPVTPRRNDLEWSLDVVYLEVTNACNLSCIHCYANAGKKSVCLSTGEMLKLVDKLCDLGVLEIVLTGGEPLMRKDIFSIMEYITRKNMDFSIFTNSLLLDKDKIRRLKELNPRMVAVSLESSKSAVHDRIRGNGSFAKAIKNIRALVKAGLPVRINVTLFRDLNDSSEQIESLLNYLRDTGIKQIAIGGLVSYGRGRLISSLIPELSAAERLAEAYKMFKTRTGRKRAPAIVFNDSFPKREMEFDKHSICGIGTYSCAIRPNGDLGLCPVLQAKTRANALRGDLKDMWLHLKDFRDFRERTVDDIAMCRVCDRRYECLGGCKASSYMHNDRFDSPDPWMCSLLGVKQKS